MRICIVWSFIIITLFVTSCARKNITQTTHQEESISTIRPSYKYKRENYKGKTTTLASGNTNSFKYDVSDSLNLLLDRFVPVPNVELTKVNGYRVQIYYGDDRTKANTVRAEAYKYFKDYRNYMEYKVPTYRVKVGNFETHEDAKKVLSKIKSAFPEAIIVPDTILIKQAVEE